MSLFWIITRSEISGSVRRRPIPGKGIQPQLRMPIAYGSLAASLFHGNGPQALVAGAHMSSWRSLGGGVKAAIPQATATGMLLPRRLVNVFPCDGTCVNAGAPNSVTGYIASIVVLTAAPAFHTVEAVVVVGEVQSSRSSSNSRLSR